VLQVVGHTQKKMDWGILSTLICCAPTQHIFQEHHLVRSRWMDMLDKKMAQEARCQQPLSMVSRP
jgi:hypothetical protein